MLELIRQFSKGSKSRSHPRSVKSSHNEEGKNMRKKRRVQPREKKLQSEGKAKLKKVESMPQSNWETFKLTEGLAGKRKRKHCKTFSNFEHKILDDFMKNSEKANEKKDISYPLHSSSKSEKSMLTNCVGLDCEMVGVYGNKSALARVSIVDHNGKCIYDKFVKPKEPVVDYRTKYSGVRAKDLINAESFEVVQKEVAEILKGNILVGHALQNDLEVLLLSHPRSMIRDTSKFKLFRDLNNGHEPSLKKLAAEILGISIQSGEHNSVEDARAAMQLYNIYQKDWEKVRTIKMRRIDCRKSQLRAKKLEKNPLMDEFTAF